MPRHVLQESVDRLAAMAAPPAAMAGGGMHTDTLLILAAVLCFILCVVGLALVARCSGLCNPSTFSRRRTGSNDGQGSVQGDQEGGAEVAADRGLASPAPTPGGGVCHLPGGVHERGRGARAPAVRPRLPRRLRRRLAPLQLHLPLLPTRPRRITLQHGS
jgi:hypothetical protein